MQPENPTSPQVNNPNENISAPQQPNPTTPTKPAEAQPPSQPPQAHPDISSIYPAATIGVTAAERPIPTPFDKKAASTQSTTFKNGYSVGGTIFWYQLIASIVFGLIMYGLTTTVLKTRSYSLAIIVSLVAYSIQYLILIYIPYSIVRSEVTEEPVWLTLFGVATQSVIIAAAFIVVDFAIVHPIINHGNTYALPNIGASGVAAIGILLWVGLLIASYFLTKLAWGAAFSLNSKLSKVIVKVVGVIVIAVFIGGIVRHYLAAYSSHKGIAQTNNTSTIQPTSLSRYKISGSPSFSVDFYKGSSFIYVQGKPQLVYAESFISFVKSNKATNTCPIPSSQQFIFYVQGSQSLGCYIPPDSSYGYFQSQGQYYIVNVYSANQQLQTIKAIFNSITVN